MAEALKRADQTDKPQVVDALTTETTEVTAAPDGTLSLEANTEPVRAEIGGNWKPIDTTLQADEGGRFRPSVTTTPMSFSGGGDSRLATIGDSGSRVSVSWDDGDLPTPVIEDNQITYPEVRPDVDLVLTANAEGYRDALVVKTPEAARDLAERPPRVTMSSSTLDVKPQADGSVLAKADDSDDSLVSPRPLAWDSSGGGTGDDRPDAVDSGSGTVQPMNPGVIATSHDSGSSLTTQIVPPASLLNDPATIYPLFLDPLFDKLPVSWVTVDSGGDHFGGTAAGEMRVGKCAKGNGGICQSNQSVARSYFNFDTTALAQGGANILDANVTAYQSWGVAGANRQVNLFSAVGANPNATWPGPAGLGPGDLLASGSGTTNTYIVFTGPAIPESRNSVYSYVATAASQNRTSLAFALIAFDESDPLKQKRFSSNVTLHARYAYAPSITASASGLVACPGQPTYSRGGINLVANAYAYGDPNPNYLFQIFNNGNQVRAQGWSGSNVANFSGLTDGTYAWRASAQSETISSTAQPADQPFTVDTIVPNPPAGISSDDYPQDYWGRSASSPGTFSVAVPDSSAVAVAYSFNGVPPAVADTTCDYTGTGAAPVTSNSATIKAPDNLNSGLNTLTVAAFDRAHNTSSTTTYQFYVSPNFGGSATATNRVELETITPATSGSVNATVATSNGATISNLTASSSGATVDYSFRVDNQGYYALGIKLRGCSNCPITVTIPDAQVAYDDHRGDAQITSSNSGYVQLGGYNLAAGNHQLHVTFPNATGAVPTQASLDYLTVAQIQGTTYGSGNSNTGTIAGNLALAFNNDGVGTSTKAASLETAPSAKSLDLEQLRNAKIVPGDRYSLQWEVPGPTEFDPASTAYATFDIPLAKSDGTDNVIAAGQHIAMPAGITADHVDFLVAVTCNPSGAKPDPHTLFDVTTKHSAGADPLTTNPGLGGTVPEWLSATAAPAGIVPVSLTSYLNGTSSVTASNRLFVIEADVAPQNRGDDLVEVGLPSTGASLTEGCGSGAPALHVMAMTTRKDTDTAPTVSYVAKSQSVANSTTSSVTVPSAVQPYDLLVMVASYGVNGTNVATPSGWTRIGYATATGMDSYVFTKRAVAGDAGSTVTTTTPSTSKTALNVMAYRGAAAVTPRAVAANDGGTTSHSNPSILLNAGDWLVRVWTEKSSATTTWTAPSGLTTRGTVFNTGSGRVSALLTDSAGPQAAGTVPAVIATTDQPSGRAISWAIAFGGA